MYSVRDSSPIFALLIFIPPPFLLELGAVLVLSGSKVMILLNGKATAIHSRSKEIVIVFHDIDDAITATCLTLQRLPLDHPVSV